MPDTDKLPPVKASVYKTPGGWVAQCSCGVTPYPSWAEAMTAAHGRAWLHQSAASLPMETLVAIVRSLGDKP